MLRLTPYAWAKLLYLRDAGPTEIGAFGITAAGEPLLVQDIRLVKQRCDWGSAAFEDGAVADFFDDQVDEGRSPEEFGRIWIHTHPGDSPQPSWTDEETFARVFGACHWAVMAIVARGGASYARLQFGVGPGGSWEVPVETAFDVAFPAANHRAWEAEYAACVLPASVQDCAAGADRLMDLRDSEDSYEWLEEHRLSERLMAEEVFYANPW